MREEARRNVRKVRLDLLWYDRNGQLLGTTSNVDNRWVDIEQLGLYPVYPNAAFLRARTVVEGGGGMTGATGHD